jgi:hypothetical protein
MWAKHPFPAFHDLSRLTYVRPPISSYSQTSCSLNLPCYSLPRVQNILPGMVDSCWTLYNAMSDGIYDLYLRGLSRLTMDSCVGGQFFDLSEAYTW